MSTKDVYDNIANQMKNLSTSIATARDLLSALKQVGEDTTEMKIKLDELERKKAKWEQMLKGRGYKV
jgi:hypothetical protein